MHRNSIIIVILTFLIQSCASKKDILYFQDYEIYSLEYKTVQETNIQTDDILSIIVSSPVPEASIPYNRQPIGDGAFSLEGLKLQGYLVSEKGEIDFPVLGKISTKGITTEALEKKITTLLKDEGHLKNAAVNVRLLNAKVTILGEVNSPGTYTFTEQKITLPQALGYAGDLTIVGERKNILLIREVDGVRTINHIDLTSANWFTGSFYYIKPNDVIVVNPNNTKVKSSGFIGNAGNVLTIASLILTSVVLLTR